MRISIRIVEIDKCDCACLHYEPTPEGGWCSKVGDYTGKGKGFPAICPLKEED